MTSSPTATPSPYVPAGMDLEALYRSWGILDLLNQTVESMPAEWLAILQIARALLDRRAIPGITLPDRFADLFARDESVQYERRTVSRKVVTRRPVREDDPEVRPIESVSELPRIITSQMMWQFINPDLFLYRLYTHDMLVREHSSDLALDPDEEEIGEEVLVPVKGHHHRRQRVLVLRDTSHSMRDNNKGIFARAAALAYLIKAQEEGAELADRSFANRVHARLRATRAEEFGAIARRILTEPFVGTTDIAAALDLTVREIRREELGLDPNARAKTEILLISDCENPVQLPLLPPGVVIHTLHLEGGREGRMLRDYGVRLREIRDVSTLFVRIDTSALGLPDAVSEAWAVREELRAAEEILPVGDSRDGQGDSPQRERALRARRLLQAYERMPGATRSAVGFRKGLGIPSPTGQARLHDLLLTLWRMIVARLVHGPVAPVPLPPATMMQSSLGDGAGRFVFRHKA